MPINLLEGDDDQPAPAVVPAKPADAPVNLLADDEAPPAPKPKRGIPLVDPMTGVPLWMSPAEQKEMARGAQEGLKGIASGAAQTVVGVPQLGARLGSAAGVVDPKWNQYIAETQKTLQEFGSPEGQTLGGYLPYALGGEILGGLRAGAAGASRLAGGAANLAGKIPGMSAVGEYLAPTGRAIASGAKTLGSYIPKAEDVLPEKLVEGYRWLKGATPEAEAATSAESGAAAEVGAAAGETEQGKKTLSVAQTAAKMLKETGKGAALGGGIGAAAPRAEGTQEERDAGMWDSIEAGLGYGASFGLGGEVLSTVRAARASANLEKQQKALAAAIKTLDEIHQATIGDVKGAVELRTESVEEAQKRIAAANTALTPTQQKIEELARLSQEAAEREAFTPEEAKKLGLPETTGATKRETAARAKEQGALLAKEEEQAQNEIVEAFKARPGMTAAEMKSIQPAAAARFEKIKENAKDVSGLSAIDKKYETKGPVFSIEPILNAIKKEALGDTSSLEGGETVRFLTGAGKRLESTAKQFGEDSKVTLKQLNDFLSEVSDAKSNGILGAAGGVRTAGADLTKLGPIEKALTESFSATDKSYLDALKKYGKEMEAAAPYKKKTGTFTGLTEKHYGKEFEIDPGEAIGQVMKRTRAGGKGLGDLVAANPEIKDDLHRYLHRELFGDSVASAKDVTSKQLNEFKREWGEVLDQTGLTKDFADLTSAREAAEQRIETASAAAAKAKEEAARTAAELKRQAKGRKLLTDRLKTEAAPHEEMIKRGAEEIQEAKDQSVPLKRTLARLKNAAVEPEDKIKEVASALETLHTHAPETREVYGEAIKKLDDAKREYTRTRDALKLARNLRAILIGKGALELLGSLGGGYGTYRLLGGGKYHD